MSGSAPTVSVIMNCLNGEKYLKEAIDSVYAQTYSDWEIVFWDNASSDRSGEIARSYDERLRYFRGDETVPLGAARNKALKKARGAFIAFLDCDDIWLPEKLSKQLPLFADPGVGIVFSNTEFFNDKGERKRLYRARSDYAIGYCFPRLLTNYFLSLETVIVRRSALENALGGWFDETLNMIEEMDLFCRIAYQWRLAMVDEVLARWRVHASSWTWARSELLFIETRRLLSKLEALIPDFQERFRKEIIDVQNGINLREALYHWKRGDGRKARSILRKDPHRDFRHGVLFLLSYFPQERILPLVYKAKNRILPGG